MCCSDTYHVVTAASGVCTVASPPLNTDGGGGQGGEMGGGVVSMVERYSEMQGEREREREMGGSLSSFLRCRSWLAATRSVCVSVCV